VDQRSSLLEQLRIERSDDTAPRSRKAVWWSVGIAPAWRRASGPGSSRCRAVFPSRSSPPRSHRRTCATAPASILDASGYVVARRQATVSAKITGKVRRRRHRGRSARRARRCDRTTRRHERASHGRAGTCRARAEQGESARSRGRVAERRPKRSNATNSSSRAP